MIGSQTGWTNLGWGAITAPVRVSRPEKENAPRLIVLSDQSAPCPYMAAFADRWAEEGYRTIVAQIGGFRSIPTEIGSFVGRIAEPHASVSSAPIGLIVLEGASDHAADVAMVLNAKAVCLVDPPDTALKTMAATRVPCIAHLSGSSISSLANGAIQVAQYQGSGPGFALPGAPAHDVFAARLFFSRTLTLFRRELGPRWDLAALFREHLRLEFEARDADATMATMVDEPYVNHVPTMSGGTGFDLLKRFYKYHFIPSTPRDRKTIILSETVGADAVVLEAINCFTHNEPYDHFLPGVPPTGKYIEIPFVAVAKFKGDKLYYEQIYWDQASVLVQLGLLDKKGLPICGREQADKVKDPSLPSNELMTNWSESKDKPL